MSCNFLDSANSTLFLYFLKMNDLTNEQYKFNDYSTITRQSYSTITRQSYSTITRQSYSTATLVVKEIKQPSKTNLSVSFSSFSHTSPLHMSEQTHLDSLSSFLTMRTMSETTGWRLECIVYALQRKLLILSLKPASLRSEIPGLSMSKKPSCNPHPGALWETESAYLALLILVHPSGLSYT
jgi:hypothetical protein